MDVKQELLEKSEQLFLRYGIRSVSMDDLARELGISKKTVYQYVQNKDDLIQQVFARRMETERTDMAGIQRNSADAVEEILQIGRYVIAKLRVMNANVLYDLHKYYGPTWKRMEKIHSDHIGGVIRENLRKGVEQGLYRANLHIDIIAKLFTGKTALVADEAYFSQQDYNLEQLFRQHLLYHIYGVAAPRGLELLRHHLQTTSRDINEEGTPDNYR